MVTASAPVSGIRGLFDGLVPAEVIDAYDRLLAANGCAKDQADALVGDTELVPVTSVRRAGECSVAGVGGHGSTSEGSTRSR